MVHGAWQTGHTTACLAGGSLCTGRTACAAMTQAACCERGGLSGGCLSRHLACWASCGCAGSREIRRLQPWQTTAKCYQMNRSRSSSTRARSSERESRSTDAALMTVAKFTIASLVRVFECVVRPVVMHKRCGNEVTLIAIQAPVNTVDRKTSSFFGVFTTRYRSITKTSPQDVVDGATGTI